MALGDRPRTPEFPKLPPVPDPAAENAAREKKAAEDALAAMRDEAGRRGRASTILAGNYKGGNTLGGGTIFGGGQ